MNKKDIEKLSDDELSKLRDDLLVVISEREDQESARRAKVWQEQQQNKELEEAAKEDAIARLPGAYKNELVDAFKSLINKEVAITVPAEYTIGMYWSRYDGSVEIEIDAIDSAGSDDDEFIEQSEEAKEAQDDYKKQVKKFLTKFDKVCREFGIDKDFYLEQLEEEYY